MEFPPFRLINDSSVAYEDQHSPNVMSRIVQYLETVLPRATQHIARIPGDKWECFVCPMHTDYRSAHSLYMVTMSSWLPVIYGRKQLWYILSQHAVHGYMSIIFVCLGARLPCHTKQVGITMFFFTVSYLSNFPS